MKLNPIFSDNMVLQATKPIYIFGCGAGTVTIEIAGKSASVVSTGDNWLLELPAFDYGGPYEMTVDLDGDTKTLKNIYFGDVYLLAGQSNIEFKLWSSSTPKTYYKDNESLRLFTVDRLEDEGEHILTDAGWKSIDKAGNLSDLAGEHYRSREGWIVAEKDSVCFWSALGYLIGDELLKRSDKKIGLIACYQGASVIQSWLPEHYLDETAFFVPLELRCNNAKFPDYSCFNDDGKLYNGMLKTVLPFALKAVVWYQGESHTNGDDSKQEVYAGILELLINKWRSDFMDESLPFIIVKIHDYEVSLNKKGNGWRNIQAAQEAVAQAVPNTYLVKSADVCETDEIHPSTKLPLAIRIADVLQNL
ncbi:MAG: hypothetical protein J6Q53_00550 [Oscillospiraceae bacterium]|nr:hypothetical protein [Oscillospiraceae bacterium]